MYVIGYARIMNSMLQSVIDSSIGYFHLKREKYWIERKIFHHIYPIHECSCGYTQSF